MYIDPLLDECMKIFKFVMPAHLPYSIKSVNLIFNLSKQPLTSTKLNLLLQNSYGLSFSKKQINRKDNFLKLKAIFYGVDLLYCIDEIPLTYEGFKILNDKSSNSSLILFIPILSAKGA